MKSAIIAALYIGVVDSIEGVTEIRCGEPE